MTFEWTRELREGDERTVTVVDGVERVEQIRCEHCAQTEAQVRALEAALEAVVTEWHTPGYQPHKMVEIAERALAALRLAKEGD